MFVINLRKVMEILLFVWVNIVQKVIKMLYWIGLMKVEGSGLILILQNRESHINLSIWAS